MLASVSPAAPRSTNTRPRSRSSESSRIELFPECVMCRPLNLVPPLRLTQKFVEVTQQQRRRNRITCFDLFEQVVVVAHEHRKIAGIRMRINAYEAACF